ncbi:hypothetical protein [Corallococcus sp. RDP092CA]|uniref:hypothetical protein n=1 Tax=Corallococcus sp. RDP092CA TaxID=3109369 RepID=UPI0035B2EFF3
MEGMGTRTPEAIRMSIATIIEDTYRESGCAVFTPGLFVDQELGSDEEVLEALRALDEEGRLREFDVLTCPYRHVLAEGRPGSVTPYLNHHCEYIDCPTNEIGAADDDDEYENIIFPRFLITSIWQSQIAGEDTQKKTPFHQR